MNAHICAFGQQGSGSDVEIPASLACSVIAPHITPIIQSAGVYADVPDLAQQVDDACEAGAWSISLRQCFVAAQTKRLKLGTGIYLPTLRHPIAAARLIATLDQLSGGRALIGVGVGWIKEEFDVLDVPWEHRSSRMEESIAVLRRLWTEPLVAHEGRFYQFAEIGSEPKPVNGTVPILIGGENDIAIRRAARIGDGWTGMCPTPEDAAERVRQFGELGAGQERPFEITVAAEGVPSLDQFRRFRDVGVDRLTIVGRLLSGGGKTVDAMLDGVTRFAEEVIDRAGD